MVQVNPTFYEDYNFLRKYFYLYSLMIDVSKENMNVSTEESSSPKGKVMLVFQSDKVLQTHCNGLVFTGSLDHSMDSQDISADMCNKSLLDLGLKFIRTNLDHAKNILHSQQGNIRPQDISQISGPEGKKSTPLSQAGFRDPASIGAGQQLTMFSIEVQLVSPLCFYSK